MPVDLVRGSPLPARRTVDEAVTPPNPSGAMGWFRRVLEVPLITFLGASPEDPDDPSAGLSMVITDHALNAAGVLHGGVIATILDLAAYLAVLPTLGEAEQAVTHSFSASYLSVTTAGETVVAKGSVLRRSRHLAFTSVSMTSDERLVAVASVTKSIVTQRP
jgi:uncharacterized protein (TIGR00369 family)